MLRKTVLMSSPITIYLLFRILGTTWIQEIVYLIMNGVDEENASKTTIDVRFPYFEYTTSLESVASLPSPRLIKSHLPISLLPSQIEEKKPKASAMP